MDRGSISYSVEASSRNTTAQLASSRALNLEVDALRVRLSAVGLTRSVQRDDLVTNDVVSRSNVGEGNVPREVVGNQIVSGPLAGVATRFPGLGGDLVSASSLLDSATCSRLAGVGNRR